MSMRGHNETPVRLGMLADDATRALAEVEHGEARAIDGWLAYGVALNEGRSLFPSDIEFGRWVSGNCSSNLEVHPAEQSAAMWAAGNLDQFEEARAAGKSRTVRGAHEKWKQIEAEREQARQAEARKAERDAAAEASRLEAEEHAKAEDAAREAAKVASSEEERQAAEARAEEAASAKAAALTEADSAASEAADPETQQPIDPTEQPIRAEFRRLTDDAREDSFVQARLLLADKEEELRKVTDRADRLEKWWNASVQGENMGRALGLAKVQVDTLTGRINEHLTKIKRLERRLKLTEAERDRLRTETENQLIPL